MSLIGPRLALPREVSIYDERAKVALRVKPGCGGVWRASLRSYSCGKVDVFSAVIALRYLLRNDEFKVFKAKLVKCVNGYLSSDESIGEERLLEAMGFPAEWKKIARYKT